MNPSRGPARAPANAPASLPVITDDGSGWASQSQKPQANPYDQFDTPPHGNRAKLTPVDYDPFKPTWSSSAFSVLPISQYGDGTYDWDSNAGMLGAAKRAGQSVLHSVENLPNLYHQVGAETAANTATPRTAGEAANLAALTTSGDMIAPGLYGTSKSMARPSVPVPTSQELHVGANADYDAMRNLDVYYDPDHVASMAQGAQDALSNQGWSSETAPKTHAILSKLANPDASGISVPLNGLAQARTILGRIGQGADRSDAGAAKAAKNALDSFIANPAPEAVLAGPAALASAYLQRANGDYAAAMRSDKVTGARDYAQFRASGANSGANLDNTIRQGIRPLFDPRFTQRRLAGFTQPEKDALSQVNQGSMLRNGLRNVSSYMGGGGGGVAALEGLESARTGNELAGPLGAAVGATVPFVGRGLRAVQNNMAKSALNKADELIRSRSPLYQERVANTPLQMPTNARGMAVVRSVNAQAQPQQDQPNQPQYAKGGKVKSPAMNF